MAELGGVGYLCTREPLGDRNVCVCIRDIDSAGLLSLSSRFRCDFDDTAQYHVSAMNSSGELSTFASVVVKSMFIKSSSQSLVLPQ